MRFRGIIHVFRDTRDPGEAEPVTLRGLWPRHGVRLMRPTPLKTSALEDRHGIFALECTGIGAVFCR